MVLSAIETFLVNRYAASELAGALLLGKMARKTDNAYLRKQLTWHCAEEARHATLWEELIANLNIGIPGVHDTEKKGYFTYFREVHDIIDFLCFVHVYELRVPFHFTLHKQWTQEESVRKVLSTLIKEEGSHISWIREFLISEKKHNPTIVPRLHTFSAFEEKTYMEDLTMLESLGATTFATLIRNTLPHYKGVLKDAAFT